MPASSREMRARSACSLAPASPITKAVEGPTSLAARSPSPPIMSQPTQTGYRPWEVRTTDARSGP